MLCTLKFVYENAENKRVYTITGHHRKSENYNLGVLCKGSLGYYVKVDSHELENYLAVVPYLTEK